jgi:hypothetical protein
MPVVRAIGLLCALRARVSPWIVCPMWLVCWLAFCGLPLSVALAPFVAWSPWPHFLALYVAVCTCFARVVDPMPPVRLDCNMDPALNLIFPHGVLCHGVVSLVASRGARPPRPVLLTPVWPLVYLILLQVGWKAASASVASVAARMRARDDMWMYPGGFREAARHSYHQDVVDVGSRGAVRLALAHGYPIRVAFAFGERKTAYNFQGLWRIRMWLAKRWIPAVVPWLVVFGKSPVRVVVSRTLAVPLIAAPTDADVERWHARYVATLRRVHADHKSADDPPLVVIDARNEK